MKPMNPPELEITVKRVVTFLELSILVKPLLMNKLKISK
jgi:hypothetical protein